MARLTNLFLSFSLMLAAAGCVNLHDAPIYPKHDEVLRFALPYDLTYLRAVEAVQTVPGWELEETEKEFGLIRARNTNYSRLDDSDMKHVDLLVKRVSREETSVEIAAKSQHVLGADALLTQIGQFASAELRT